MLVSFELVYEFKEPVVVSIKSTLFFKFKVVVAIDELNVVFPLANEFKLAETDELKESKSIPCIVPVTLSEPVIVTSSPKVI